MTRVMIIAETCMDGVGKHVSDLIRYLDKTKYAITVLHGTKRMDYYFLQVKNDFKDSVTFVEISSMSRSIHPVKDLKAYSQIDKQIKHIKPEIVHCHSSKAGVLGRLSAIGKPYVCKVFYTPHAYAIQNLDLNSYRHLLFLKVERWLGHRKKMLTLNVSNGEQSFALRHGIVDHSEVIYNAIDDRVCDDSKSRSHHRTELGVTKDDILVICVARLYHQKNPQEFLKVAETIISQRKNVKFVWVGEGEMLSEMRSQVSDDRISFIGHKENIHVLLCAADIFFSTALYEGLPYTLIEACRASLPIVASDITGNNEVVKDGVNGLLYNEDAIDRLCMLIDMSEYREELGHRAREIYENRFGINQMIESIEKLYDGEGSSHR